MSNELKNADTVDLDYKSEHRKICEQLKMIKEQHYRIFDKIDLDISNLQSKDICAETYFALELVKNIAKKHLE